MKDKLWMLSLRIQNLLKREEGQDLIEYALLAALMALGATATMKGLGNEINVAFNTITTNLTNAVG